MIATRTAAVAGTFYPADPAVLQHEVDELLAGASCDIDAPPNVCRPKALIVPHAGYRFSGPTAATAYRCLSPVNQDISRVIVIGPCHRIPLRGMAAPSAATFQTPLGDVPVDRQSIDKLVRQALVTVNDDAHQFEHSIEVQLPFLQRVLHEFTVLPLVVGNTPREHVTDVLRRLWGSGETLIVISTDLSHYHHYQDAQRLDKLTSTMIEGFDSHLTSEQACGSRAVNGLLKLAEEAHLKLHTLDVRNSGDTTAGDKDRVVGYGAYVIY
ncbi:AmmeMemoRadiSam system protein B [uncultured Porticoccus sp.]|uniref:AmmeMemoRadiSam system protein B n=1 Tax=uncultured Porticoccus sp. TaxID=1256050 RepID=UPI0030D77A8B|tara:strand:- start:974 stop:1777 length:804 start_codon:yes stop_codon:yes gene_type:complete